MTVALGVLFGVGCDSSALDPACSRPADDRSPPPACGAVGDICAAMTSCAGCVSTYPCGWSVGTCMRGGPEGPDQPSASSEWIYLATGDASCDGASRSAAASSMNGAALIRHRREDPSYQPFGLNHVISWVDLSDNPDDVWRRKLQSAKDAGVQFIRGHGMSMIEMVNEDYHNLDRVLRITQEFDLPTLHVFSTYDTRLEDDGIDDAEWWTAPGWFDEWESVLTLVAAKYAGTVRYWQINNEPNNEPNYPPEVYAEVMIRAHRAIKAADPANVIVWGGLGEKNYHGGPIEYVRRFMEVPGASESFDVMGIHPYTMFDTMIVAVLDLVGHREMWIDEFGSNTHCDPERRGEMLRGFYIRFLSRYPEITKFFWYAYGETVPELQEYNMVEITGAGTDTQFEPLPSYYAFKTLEEETRPCTE